MDDYISKPIQQGELRRVIGAACPSNDTPNSGVAAPMARAFDIDRALQMLDGERELLGELVEIFQNNLNERLAAIRTAVANRDLPALAKAAHAIKSPVGTLSAQPAFDAILKLEQLARGGDNSAFEGALTAALGEIARLQPELDAFTRDNATLVGTAPASA